MSSPELAWHEPGDIMGQQCSEWRADMRGGCGGCGGNMRVVSIQGDPHFEWSENQALVTEGMELDLTLKCISCGVLFEGAIYHDDLWEVEA
ncbi:hypothetical protein Q0M94_28475 (plasmid) [Deinococcus radiomollis]|uniref:hypothetical protein n=1 Tax=Deinococcus radiomollis TaxID=468916 RepID=UPI003892BAB5